MMSLYFYRVVVKNRPKARWRVEEFPLALKGYHIGVEEGVGAVMGMQCRDLWKRKRNSKHQFLTRLYRGVFELM